MSSRPKGIFTPAAAALAQHRLTECRLLHRENREHLGLLTSLQGKYAGAWVSALPTTEYLTLTPEEWRTLVRTRTGITIPHLVMARNCPDCRNHFSFLLDPTVARHALRCSHHRGTIITHNAVRDVVFAIAKEAKLSPLLEDSTLLNPKRVDVACTNHEKAQQWGLDVVIADAQKPEHCGPQQLKIPGTAAATAEREKATSYLAALGSKGRESTIMRPLAIETMGAMGEKFQSFLSDCAARKQEALHMLPEDTSVITQAMAQRISMALMKAQAHVIHMRAKPAEDPRELLFRTTIHTAADLDYVGREKCRLEGID